jgi:hypothetical protein
VRVKVRNVGGDRFVIFVDEGQNWSELELTWLRDVTNQLDKESINVLVVMFGDQSLQRLRNELVAKGRHDLLGRFFLRLVEFPGLRGVDELRMVLAIYDSADKYEYPLGSGISYSRFFLPRAFENGWRLASEAESMWAEFVSAGGRNNFEVKEVGMHWVGLSVRQILFSLHAEDRPGFVATSRQWAAAVRSSGFEQSFM